MKQIECADVSQSYGRKNALFHVDCVIEAGKVCALCGGNGAGKTTLMKLFAGLLLPERGSVRIDGQAFSGRDIREALQLKSSCFSISVQGDQVTFTVEGSGHGVGMSQEGAQGMALEGYDHHEILTHYYTGISFADVYKS